MTSKKNIIRNVILLVSILIFVGVLVFSLGDIKKIYQTIITADYKYILGILGLLGIYLILWPLSLTILARKDIKNLSYGVLYKISASEFFFNGITPFSSGGQPFQAYSLKERGVKLSTSTSILMINFIIYQVVINLFSILAIAFYFQTIKETIANFIWFAIIGFTMNFLILLLLILLAISKKVGFLIHRFLVFLTRFRLFRRLEKNIPVFDAYVVEVQSASRVMVKNYPTILLVLLVKIFALAIYYAIPYLGIKALHIEISLNDLFYVIAMTCFALTMVVWLPTPGSSGGVELAFSAIFSGLAISTNLSLSLMLIWRFSTYYIVMLYGLIMYLWLERGKKNENRDFHGRLCPTDKWSSDSDNNS